MFVFFAVSRSFGHLVKQALIFYEMKHIWKMIAPFSGAVNTATFVAVFAFAIHFHRSRITHEEIEQHRKHLEENVRERTRELVDANTQLVNEIKERTRIEEALVHDEERLEALLDEFNIFEALGMYHPGQSITVLQS